MNRQEREHKDQIFFCEVAAALVDRKITPKQACVMIERARDAKIFPDDTFNPEEEERQKGFNEIARVLADWKITTEEACALFEAWNDEWTQRCAVNVKGI